MLRAALTGVLPGVVAMLASSDPRLSAGIGCAVMTGAWWVEWNGIRAIRWAIEELTGADLDGDGWVGEPEFEPEPSQPSDSGERPIILHAPDNSKVRRERARNERLARDLAQFLTVGNSQGFAHDLWVGQVLATGTEVTDSLWREWTDIMVNAGILEKDNQGTRLIVALKDALECMPVA